MARILLTWELGAGLGHMSCLRSIAAPLIAQGHKVSVALRDLTRAYQIFQELTVDFYQAPFVQVEPFDCFRPAATFPHVLYNSCCGDIEAFRVVVEAWRNIYRCIRPDFIICDHSPSALFASRGCGIQTASMGIGFFIPPNQTPLPSWRPELRMTAKQCSEDEERVLNCLNQVAAKLKLPGLTQISDLYNELDANFLVTYPELDHFQGRQFAEYLGTWHTRVGVQPTWPEVAGPRFFAYLKPFPALGSLIEYLSKHGFPTILYAPNANLTQFISEGRIDERVVQISSLPVDLVKAGEQCDFAITNGTHGTITTLLGSGRAIMNIPLTLEQKVLTDRVIQFGAGISLGPNGAHAVPQAIESLTTRRQLAQCAAAFSEQYGAFQSHANLDRLLTRVRAYVD